MQREGDKERETEKDREKQRQRETERNRERLPFTLTSPWQESNIVSRNQQQNAKFAFLSFLGPADAVWDFIK